MSAAAEPHRRVSLEDYLTLERRSETKSEYLNGEVIARAGASRRHNLIGWNLASMLHAQLQGRECEAYLGDMRVFIPSAGLYTYPDVVVACGEPRFEDGELDTLLNPTLVIEILSPTTEGYDRGKKAAHYRSLDSLRQYLLVSQEEVRVELLTRQEDGHWLLTDRARGKRASSSPRSAARCAWRISTSGWPTGPRPSDRRANSMG